MTLVWVKKDSDKRTLTAKCPAFEDLSPEKQWDVVQKAKRHYLLNYLIAGGLSGACLLPVLVPGINKTLDSAISTIAKTNRLISGVFNVVDGFGVRNSDNSAQFKATAKEGDVIAGHKVTSAFNPARVHPVSGEIRPHNGVDVGTPTGTPLYAPVTPTQVIKVRCWWDGSGGGNVATWTQPDGKKMQALHLSRCSNGSFDGGEKFAETGATGEGTGPHLHFEQFQGEKRINPYKGYVTWLLTGQKPGELIDQTIKDDIKASEGLRLNAYLDPVGVPTIGWGTTVYPDGRKVQMGDTITREQAEQFLQHDIASAANAVDRAIETPLKASEKQALTSFTYNVGAGALEKSELAQKLNQGDRKGAAAEFDRWVHGDGVVLPGLVERRAKEKRLFLED